MEGRCECFLFCWFVLVSWCVGAVNGLGYCMRRKREGGGIEEKKKSVENRDGIFLLGFSLFLFQVAMEGGRKRRRGGQYCFFLFLFLPFLVSLPTLPCLT